MHELDATTFPAWRDAIAAAGDAIAPPRSYPGYPAHPLPAVRRRRRGPGLERALAERRSPRALGTEFPAATVLARVLWHAHGARDDHGRGPVPSAGGVQGIELYLAVIAGGWLPAACYHYDRVRHLLARVGSAADRDACARRWVPSLATVDGGALLWIVVGDRARVAHRYGDRAPRFLALEAGHLMQNLCLMSCAAGLGTLPLGGFYERALARALSLPRTDLVLYTGLCGPT